MSRTKTLHNWDSLHSSLYVFHLFSYFTGGVVPGRPLPDLVDESPPVEIVTPNLMPAAQEMDTTDLAVPLPESGNIEG